MAEGQDKKHSATDRRREKAREEGQVSKSADLSSAAMLMIALVCLRWLGGPLCQRVATGMSQSLSGGLVASWTFQDAMNQLLGAAALLALAVLPVLLVMFAAGIAVNVSQTGLMLTPSAVALKLSHISPLSGVKRIASVRGLMRLGFGIFKVLVISLVAYAAVRSRQDAIIMMWSETVPVLARALFENLFEICIWIAAALLALGVVEWAFQKWRYEEDLKMSDQEMRDEMKESQGDPQTQMRRKQMQRQLMMQRINSDVPGADVVITNPTELAIAISYKPQEMVAPIVIAKGAGAVAQRIRRIALEHGVPVVERKPLAQFLYKTVDVGGTIPAEQYQAVAEVLRYVYQLKGKPLPKAG
jgi:flagellar biosynthesis protein FlhB